jgi:hypothetical protein
MKYYTWKLKWENGEGTDPTFTVNNDDVRIEPAFATGDVQDPSTLIYCYLLRGELDMSQLTVWSVTETTLENMLAAAQVLDSGAVVDGELIKFTPIDILG